MARASPQQELQPSVLDRLLDDEPDTQRELPLSRTQQLRALHRSVRRDLEFLLNTRRRCSTWPDGLTELEHSLVNYGLPDFIPMNLASAEGRETFRRMLEEAIRRCEPRFKSVSVHLLDNTEPLDRTLRFRIDALLYAEPAPEPIVFDSVLEPMTCNFALKGERP